MVPDFPWHQRLDGTGVLTLHMIDAAIARHFVPRTLELVAPLPGKTLAMLYWARFGAGSDLPHHELTVACASVRYGEQVVPWVSHVYIDERAARERARLRLGMRCEPADFPGDPGRPRWRTASRDGQLLCRLRVGRTLWGWRRRVQRIAMHQDADNPDAVWLHGNEIAGRVGIARARLDVPRESPLHVLGLGRPLVTLCLKDGEGIFAGADFLPRHTISAGALRPRVPARGGAA